MAQSIPGTQVVSRAAAVLRVVSSHTPDGVTSSQVATLTSLTRPTAHRLLASLAAEGFLDQDSRTSTWHLGPELYLMGAVAAPRYDITTIAQPLIHELASETGESAFLSARRGYETVCLVREEGAFPIRSFVLYEGVRFPLGVASAGMAILAFLPDDEIDAYLAHRESISTEFQRQHTPNLVWQRIREARARGYSVNPGLIVQGSFGIGAAVFDESGRPAWALSLTGVESRFSTERQPELGRLLVDKAHALTQLLKGRRP
ncbi:MAG: IclR family transcriptional regulator [Microbacteriaceae bacterium]